MSIIKNETMEILELNDLKKSTVKKQFDKVIKNLQDNDFKSADVKKMQNTGFYRAKLDDTNRLLFKFGKYQNKTYLIVLEVILNHAYEKSRFLNGAAFKDTDLQAITSIDKIEIQDIEPINYINKNQRKIYFLNKTLSFDDVQEQALQLTSPCIIIGSAGSGKTAISLEKMKTLTGKILYTTRSGYLMESASQLYYSNDYENPQQEIDFYTIDEYLFTYHLPQEKEVTFKVFEQWISRYKQSHKIKDTHKVYEEFKGVITGGQINCAYLSESDYVNLGIKQSIFKADERASLYQLFTKYLDWMKESKHYEINCLAFDILPKITPEYDYIIVDEVQDIPNILLHALLKSLKKEENFILCGDSNQIVHPNFFSWTQVKQLFYHQNLKQNITHILSVNYRNTPEVTAIANKLLMLKNARFGSIDKESSYLVQSNASHKGVVEFLECTPATQLDMNVKTKKSVKFAILVLRNEDKAEARKYFETPLLFSIQEAKGLEYENIILFNILSNNAAEFRAIASGINKEDITEESFNYARNKDKTDRSLDEYKFYINSLYVGITRAMHNLYVLETNKKNEILHLLDLTDFKNKTSLANQLSTLEDWTKEANKLAKQGKDEQAEAIKTQFLKKQALPYTPLNEEALLELLPKALNKDFYNKKAKDILFNHTILNSNVTHLHQLSLLKYNLASNWKSERKNYFRRIYPEYVTDNLKLLVPKLEKYGIDYLTEVGYTPLMLACFFGAQKVCDYLIDNGADTAAVDMFGKNALQVTLVNAMLSDDKKSELIKHVFKYFKNEPLRLQFEDKLIKIDVHQGEYWMVQLVLATSQMRISSLATNSDNGTLHTDVYNSFFEDINDNIIPEFRKKRAYISALLAKNEINKQDKYNKKLFLRLRNGIYILNPGLKIYTKGNWVSQANFYGFNTFTHYLSDTNQRVINLFKT